MRQDRLPKIALFGEPSKVKRKAGCPRLGWEKVIKKDLKEMVAPWEGVNTVALNRWRRSLRSFVSLRRVGYAVSC